MNEIIKKARIKCVPIVITPEIREQIRLFKERLTYLLDHPELSSEFDAKTIDIVLNQLDDYDRNILIAYYELANCSITSLSRIFNISPTVLKRRIKIIHNKIIELNDVPKSSNNKSSCNPDC